MKQHKFFLTLVLLFALLQSACAAQPATTQPNATTLPAATNQPADDTVTGSELKDIQWVLQTLNEQPVLADAAVTLKLDATHVSGSDGCNSFSGTYQSEGSQFKVNPDLASTMMACAEPVMTQASAYVTALTQATQYKLDGQNLLILDAAGKTLAVFKR